MSLWKKLKDKLQTQKDQPVIEPQPEIQQQPQTTKQEDITDSQNIENDIQLSSEEMELPQITEEQLIELMKKNLSKLPEDELSDEELFILAHFKHTNPDLWKLYLRIAKSERKSEMLLNSIKKNYNESLDSNLYQNESKFLENDGRSSKQKIQHDHSSMIELENSMRSTPNEQKKLQFSSQKQEKRRKQRFPKSPFEEELRQSFAEKMSPSQEMYHKLKEIQQTQRSLQEQERSIREEFERSINDEMEEIDSSMRYAEEKKKVLFKLRNACSEEFPSPAPKTPNVQTADLDGIIQKVNLISAKQKLLHMDFMQLRNSVHKSLSEFKLEMKKFKQEMNSKLDDWKLPSKLLSEQNKDLKENEELLLNEQNKEKQKTKFDYLEEFEHETYFDNDEMLNRLNERQDVTKKQPSLKVFVRLRQHNNFYKSCIQILDANSLEISNDYQKKVFTFDKIYGPLEGQEEIWEHVSESVNSVIDGTPCCFIAYGETGSGKTYTLQGDATNSGLLPRFMAQMFNECEKKSDVRKIRLKISAVEIKANYFRDLLSTKNNIYTKYLPPQNTTKAELKSFSDFKAVQRTIENALSPYKFRSGSNIYSERNPRANLVITIYVEQQGKVLLDEHESTCIFVELGGSELLERGKVGRDAILEYKQLERNLGAIADVLNSLMKRASFIPYRNSKLTLFLQDFLRYDSHVYFYVCVHPPKEYFTENMRTLKYASRIKTTRNTSQLALKSEFEKLNSQNRDN